MSLYIRANIRVAISATQFMERLKDFPWPERVLKLDELIPSMESLGIVFWHPVDPGSGTLTLAAFTNSKGRGSQGGSLAVYKWNHRRTKGVVISHRNVVGNVSQFRQLLDARESDAILASLPFFHTFGSTVTLWYRLIEGVRIVTYPTRSTPQSAPL